MDDEGDDIENLNVGELEDNSEVEDSEDSEEERGHASELNVLILNKNEFNPTVNLMKLVTMLHVVSKQPEE